MNTQEPQTNTAGVASALTGLLDRIGDEIHANKIAHGWKIPARTIGKISTKYQQC